MRSINLVPSEGRRQDESRRRLLIYAGVFALFILVLGAITIWRQGAVRDAEDELNDQIAANQQLQAQINSLAGAEDLQAQYLEAVATLTLALENDVDWGRLLNDLGRLIPDRVWVDSYAGVVNRGDPNLGIGEISFAGTAFSGPDVANWIRVLDSDQFPGVVGTWATGLSASEISDVEVVTFTSSTNLNEEALSDRLDERIPGIP